MDQNDKDLAFICKDKNNFRYAVICVDTTNLIYIVSQKKSIKEILPILHGEKCVQQLFPLGHLYYQVIVENKPKNDEVKTYIHSLQDTRIPKEPFLYETFTAETKKYVKQLEDML